MLIAPIVLALSLLVPGAVRASEQVAAVDPAPPALRLPSGARPLAYDLSLTIVPGRPDASGEVAIDVELDTPHAILWLHAQDVRVSAASAGNAGVRVTVHARSEHVGLAFEPPLPAGRHRLALAFASEQRRTAAQGLFTMQQDGAWYTMTHFEPVAARRAFPCFDEPSFKVPWTIALTVPSDLVAVSNAPEQSTEAAADGMKTVRFAPTRPLPTYLVAFAVGPWSIVDAGSAGERPTPNRIVVPRGRASEAAFAASAFPAIFAHAERWFGIAHPFLKLDHAAIPLGVGFAMENAGLITYAERILLAPPGEQSARFRRIAASLGAHEIAHQWFGNLVTPRWWDDLWLNESFANWLTNKLVVQWRPEWARTAPVVFERATAMEADASASARRVREPIADAGDIRNAFDPISYQKGATVIAMFERWIGEATFRRAVRRYLDLHRDANASTDEFLAALQRESGLPVAAAFSTFLDQNGIPLVSVALRCDGRARLALSQSRYAPLGAPGAEPRRWQIPVCVRYGDGRRVRDACTLLTDATAEMPLPGSCPAFVMANAGGESYYLPRYEGDLPARLRASRAALTPAEQASVVLDLKPLVASGAVPASDAMAWLAAAARSREPAVVRAAVELAEFLRANAVADEDMAAFAAFTVRAFRPRARALGLVPRSGEPDDEGLLRRAILSLAGADDPALAKEARRLSRAWLGDTRAIDPALVEPVLVTAARTADAALFDALLEKALAARTAAARREPLVALFAFRDPALARRAAALMLDERFDARDLSNAFRASVRDREDARRAQDMLAAHFDALAKRASPEAPAWWPWYAASLCGDAAREEVEAFWRDRAARYPGAERNAKQVVDRIARCTAVRDAQQASVRASLARASR